MLGCPNPLAPAGPRYGWACTKALGLASAVAGAVAVVGCGAAFVGLDAQAANTWHRTYSLAPSGEVRITNTNGGIDVEGVDGGVVDVTAERIARAATEAVARDLLPRVTIKESVSADGVSLETERVSGILVGAAYLVAYHVRAPRSAAVRIVTTNGSLSINRLDGRVTAQTVNGAFRGAHLGGGADVRSVNGTIDAQFAAVRENIALTTVNGAIRLALPDTARVTVTATWINGTLNTSGLHFDGANQSRRRFEGRLNGGGTPIDIRTTNGRIRVEAADEGGAAPTGHGGS